MRTRAVNPTSRSAAQSAADRSSSRSAAVKRASAAASAAPALQRKAAGEATAPLRGPAVMMTARSGTTSLSDRRRAAAPFVQLAAVIRSPHRTAHSPTAIVQRKENRTGLPDTLKSGVENLSGHSMDDVRVHYNSPKPSQLNAHAFAQGREIHVGPGQEKHLPHEAWHVVQQAQGRVRATRQLKGTTAINDDPGLEKEADVMGAKAAQLSSAAPVQRAAFRSGAPAVITQRSRIIANEYQNLEPPMETVVKVLMRWSLLGRGQVLADLNPGLWGMTGAQFATLTHPTLERPTRVIAYLNGVVPAARVGNVQTGIGHIGDLEDLLRGRGAAVYHGGHVLGNQYAGFWADANTPKNLAPQSDNSNTNGGAWYNQEMEVARIVGGGMPALLDAWVTYPAQTYSVPYWRIKSLVTPGTPTALALDRWVYGMGSDPSATHHLTAGRASATSAWTRLQSAGTNLRNWNVRGALSDTAAAIGHSAASVGRGIAATAVAPVDMATGLKNQVYVTVNTWTPAMYNLKYTTYRGMERAPRGAKHKPTLEGGTLGGLVELLPSAGILLRFLEWLKVPVSSVDLLKHVMESGSAHLPLVRGGLTPAVRATPGYEGYTSASPLGGTVVENQAHRFNNLAAEILGFVKEVPFVAAALHGLTLIGIEASQIAGWIYPYIGAWLPAWTQFGVTEAFIASQPLLASAILIWLAYHQMPSIRRFLGPSVEGVLDKLGI